jgi:hypothetical protein
MDKITLYQESRVGTELAVRFGAIIFTSKIISSFYLNLLDGLDKDYRPVKYRWKFFSGKPFELMSETDGKIQNHIF